MTSTTTAGVLQTRRLLEGKVTIVTGASRGIGASAARAFADAGANVVLAARDEESLETIADEIRSSGGDAIALRTDVSDPASVERLVELALELNGRLDGAFNNAGDGYLPTPLAEVEIEDFDRPGATALMRMLLPA